MNNNKIIITKELFNKIVSTLKECNSHNASEILKEFQSNKENKNSIYERELRIKKKLPPLGLFTQELEKWNEEHPSKSELNIFKINRLLFFASAAYTPMLEIFDNFIAVRHGHIEDVCYKIKDIKYIKNQYNSRLKIQDFDPNVIKTAVKELKNENFDLISMGEYDMFKLSREWNSWKIFFAKAKKLGSKSHSIPTDFIKEEPRYFY